MNFMYSFDVVGLLFV